jgi:hypothetical protein
MAERPKGKSNVVTLDIEMQDLLDVVSKPNSTFPSNANDPYLSNLGGEDLKKAWFKHVLISVEKLNDQIESLRYVEMVNLRSECKDDIGDLKELIKKIETKAEKNDDELKMYKKEIIVPLSNTVVTLTVKLGIWSLIAGFIGSGVMGIILRMIKN